MTASPTETPAAEPTFDALPLGPDVRRAIDAMGYRSPTPVQRAVFEPAVEGRDSWSKPAPAPARPRRSACRSSTGSCACRSRASRRSSSCPRASWRSRCRASSSSLGQFRGMQVVAIYGGAPMSKANRAALEAGAQIVVGTPGRVLDHLRHGTLDPSGIRILVLDEADEMLSMGFAQASCTPSSTALPKEPPGPVLQRHHPAGHRAARAQPAAGPRVHHALERPGRRARNHPLTCTSLQGGDKVGARPHHRGRGPGERHHLLQHQGRDRARRRGPQGPRVRRRLAQRRSRAERPRARDARDARRASCGSSWRPTSRRAGSTSRT